MFVFGGGGGGSSGYRACISCELFAGQTTHRKCQALFSLKKKKNLYAIAKEKYLMIILEKLSQVLLINIYVVGTHYKHLTEALLMCTHNICFMEK